MCPDCQGREVANIFVIFASLAQFAFVVPVCIPRSTFPCGSNGAVDQRAKASKSPNLEISRYQALQDE